MMQKLKKNMKPTLVLGAICIIVAALLAAVNLIADPIIKDRDAKAAIASLTEVMPEGDFDTTPDTLRPDAPKTVKAVYTDKNGGGYVVLLTTTKGYTGNEISITVAIGTDGKIINAAVTKNDESIKNIIVPGGTYGESYKGVGADGLEALVTGATVKYTEAAIKAAIYDAFTYLGFAEGELDTAPDEETEKPEITLLRPEDEVITEIKALTGATTTADITPGWGRPYNMPKLYKLDGEIGYAAYLATLGWGNYPVSEGIVHIGADGEVKALKMLRWTPGYDKEKFDAPPPFTDAIVESYIGRDFWHIDEAELVSSATGTSTDFKNAVADALRYITINLVERSDEKVLELARELVPFASGFEPAEIPGMPETVKRFYKVEGIKGGYLAHIIVGSDRTHLASEALVYFDKDAAVGAIKLLSWNVGHGVEPGDFAEGFVGKNKDNISEVELVSAATGTSGDFRDEMAKIIPLIPEASSLPVVIGAVALCVFLAGFIAALIYFKRRNRAK